MGIVGLTQATYSNINQKISLSIGRGRDLDINNGYTIVIKINLCDFRMPETGAVTHPIFLDAFLNYLRTNYKNLRIKVVESDATVARPDLLIKWLGFEPIFKKHSVEYVNLTKDIKIVKKINGRYFKKMKIPKNIYDSDYLISMSKLKTCLLTKITCTLKNQFGCIPDPYKIKFHKNLDDVIVDANIAMKPDFSIVDGIIAMGGVKGPDLGVPIKTNLVITGKDPVSVDSVCARIIGFNPSSVAHIRKAQSSGVGFMKYKIVGSQKLNLKRDFEFNKIYAWILNKVMSMKN